MIQNFEKGDLVAWASTVGPLHAGIFMGSGGTYHFWALNQSTLDRIAAGKKPLVDYITGYWSSRRVVKITPDILDPEELRVYKQLKGEKNEATDGN